MTSVRNYRVSMNATALDKGWRYYWPNETDLESFCKWAEDQTQNGRYRIASITPVHGSLGCRPVAGVASEVAGAATCGFIVVFEST